MKQTPRRKTRAVKESATDPEIRRVLDSLRRVVRALRLGSRQAEKQVGLSGAQLFVLQKIAEAEGLSVNEVAERTHTHQSSVSAVVQRLVDQKLVVRRRSTRDARLAQLSVTAAGKKLLAAAPAAAQDRLINALLQTQPTRVKALADALQSLADLLGVDAGAPAVMLFEEEEETTSPPRRRPQR